MREERERATDRNNANTEQCDPSSFSDPDNQDPDAPWPR